MKTLELKNWPGNLFFSSFENDENLLINYLFMRQRREVFLGILPIIIILPTKKIEVFPRDKVMGQMSSNLNKRILTLIWQTLETFSAREKKEMINF